MCVGALEFERAKRVRFENFGAVLYAPHARLIDAYFLFRSIGLE